MLKKIILLISLVFAVIMFSGCSSSFEQQTLKKAKMYKKKALSYQKKGIPKGYMVYTNKALIALLKYMQKDTPTVAIRSMYVNTSFDLGKAILAQYSTDPDGKNKIANLYENLEHYIYKTSYDTLKIKKKTGTKIKVKKEVQKPLPQEFYRNYANLLISIADTIKAFDNLRDGYKYLLVSRKIDSTSSNVKSALKRWKKDLAADALSRAEEFYQEIEGEKEPDPDPTIAAEYFTRLALKFEPDNKKANEMLSKIYPVMTNVYSAYDRLMQFAGLEPEEFDPDIDNNDILIAVTSETKRGSTIKMDITIYNNSYNAIEIRPDVFALVDKTGHKYFAKKTNKKTEIPSKILDTEFQEQGEVTFPNVSRTADIIKIIYYMERPLENGGKEIHQSTKYLKWL